MTITVPPPRRQLAYEPSRAIHPTTPLGDARDHAVTCTKCRSVQTFNVCALCNLCCSSDCPDGPLAQQRGAA